MGDGLNRTRHGSSRLPREQHSVKTPTSSRTQDDSFLGSSSTERKNGVGNIYCQKSQGTLLDKWKEYTEGEDEDAIIKNIYTPQSTSGGSSVVVAKKEMIPSDESREKLRDLRKKAMVREQEELDTTQTKFTSQQVIIKYDTQDLDVGGLASGGNFYTTPNQKSTSEEPVSDDENHNKKEQWYKKARKIFLPKN